MLDSLLYFTATVAVVLMLIMFWGLILVGVVVLARFLYKVTKATSERGK